MDKLMYVILTTYEVHIASSSALDHRPGLVALGTFHLILVGMEDLVSDAEKKLHPHDLKAHSQP